MTRHLFVSISAHGFGHAAQTSAVVNALWERRPDLRVTLQSALAPNVLARFFPRPFDLIERACDVGLLMASPLEVLAEDSAEAYEAFHADWEGRVEAEAAALAGLGPDLVFANVPYLTVAAAARAGIPAVAMCSLNWADLYRDFCGGRPEAARIHRQIAAAYQDARLFLQPAPSMPMDWLPRRRAVGALARIGRPRRAELTAALGVGREQTLVLVAFGGIAGDNLLPSLPREPDITWLVDGPIEEGRGDLASVPDLDWPFPDLLRSVDAIVTKAGYGTVAEAACNGTAVLYLSRGDWAEEPYLVDWLERRGRCRQIDRAALASGRFVSDLRAVLAQPKKPRARATGGSEAAEILASLLA